MFETLSEIPADPIMAIMEQFRNDTRDNKIDLGPGVFKNDQGNTTVMKAVKMAEASLIENQKTKSYVSVRGNSPFLEKLRLLALGDVDAKSDNIASMQTSGGTGALSLAAMLIKASSPQSKILVGTPTWANHKAIFEGAGLELKTHRYYDEKSKQVDIDAITSAIQSANAGDVILLHACCHNPTGANLTLDQWRSITELCNQQGVIPFVDMAYQGFGLGLEEDRLGVSHVIRNTDKAIVAVSCSKNFGLYRERVGGLFVFDEKKQHVKPIQDTLLSFARRTYSMPAGHGAEIVNIILGNETYKSIWQEELEEMRNRVQQTRRDIVKAMNNNPDYLFLQEQLGMFSLLPLTPEQVTVLKNDHAIYMPASARINIAGLKPQEIEIFAHAINSL